MTRDEAIELVLAVFADRPSGPAGAEVLSSLGVRTPFDEAVARAAEDFKQELAEALAENKGRK